MESISFNMYFCRVKKRKRKKFYQKSIFFILFFVAMVSFLGQRKTLFKVWKQEIQNAFWDGMTNFIFPGYFFEKNGEQGGILYALEKQIFPVADYTVSLKAYETQIESDLSYDMILAREALDENYVDENGQVVITNVSEDMVSETETEEVSGNDTIQPEPEAVTEQQTAEAGEVSEEIAEAAKPVTAEQKVVEYSLDKLSDYDYLIQNFYQVDSTTTIKSDQLNVTELMGKNMNIAHDASTPQILIYHTHSLEGYADSVPGDQSTTVVGVGDYLTKLLTEQYGFNVIHDKGQYDTVRDKAYSTAAPAVEKILADNPSIDVVIDLHRDGVGENTRLVTNVNGTDMAKVMFFNGLSRTTALGDISYLYNPYIADNLAFSFQMQLTAAEYYPGYTRKIYLKGYRFNMHYCPKTLLVEVGAQTNTVQEAMNAMVPLADVLNKVLTEQR